MRPTRTTTIDPPNSPAPYHMNPAMDSAARESIKGGCPKVTTNKNKIARIKVYKAAVNGAAQKN